MASQTTVFHALLRPSILQILRATGYHSTRPAVLDSLTDLAARYLLTLCEGTAAHATHNHGQSADFDITDVRLALQDAGALLPCRTAAEEEWLGEEDLRGVEEFVAWFGGERMKEMMEHGNGDGEADATDYLNALKKKHSKTGDDAKYHGTILGRGLDSVAEVQVEGGPVTSIRDWILKRSSSVESDSITPEVDETQRQGVNGHIGLDDDDDSSLSSMGDRLGNVDDMDLS